MTPEKLNLKPSPRHTYNEGSFLLTQRSTLILTERPTKDVITVTAPKQPVNSMMEFLGPFLARDSIWVAIMLLFSAFHDMH